MQLSQEEQLLVQCSRVKMSDTATAHAAAVMSSKIDWDYLLEASIRHGTSPLFHLGLESVLQRMNVAEPPPTAIRRELHRLYCGNRRRNERLYCAIGEIATAFAHDGIQALGLKDLQLAWEVYPDLGMRTMGDIDILIHRSDYGRVAACMKGLGFHALPSSDIPFTLKYAWAHHFQRPSDNLWVDLQWNIVQREWDIYGEGNFDFEFDRMWAAAKVIRFGNYPMLVPNPEDMLFHLCLHLEGHQYSELILFCDIAVLLEYYQESFDWHGFITMTKKYRAESSVYYVLLLTQRLFEVEIPAAVINALTPTYFNANLFKPLFDNLTLLHLSLDDIRIASSPPERLQRKWETVVRRQTVGAMRAYRELDTLAVGVAASGASSVIFSGLPSEKVFPDAALESFAGIHALTLHQNLARIREVLIEQGFSPSLRGGPSSYEKQLDVESRDPALDAKATRVHLRVEIDDAFESFVFAGERAPTKKDIALRSLRRNLFRTATDDVIRLKIKILALNPDQMIVSLCSRIGRQRAERLFALCSIFEFLRSYSGPLDWRKAREIARRSNLMENYEDGVRLTNSLLVDVRLADFEVDPLRKQNDPPKLFEWARYGPNSLDRHPELKRAFYFVFTLLSLEGLDAKRRYLRQLFRRHPKSNRVLPALFFEFLGTSRALFTRRQPNIRDFAYWIERDDAVPEPTERTLHERT